MKSSMQLSRRELLAYLGALGLARAARPGDAAAPGPIFQIVPPAKSGIAWVHDNGKSPEHWLPEAMCSGCAFLDYDNDGWMDILLINTGPSVFYHPKNPGRNALYHNNRNGTFTDVTKQAGLDAARWGEGVAVGDYNGDGYQDILFTSYGGNFLYRNNRNGTFTDVTAQAGLGGNGGWTTSAVWFDYDNDGRLDLFVGVFVDYGGDNPKTCGQNQAKKRYYCVPSMFDSRYSTLYHNNGDGTFTETGHLTDIGKNPGKCHGVVATDINNDGLMDLFVTNDLVPNFLYVNRGNGKFEEIGLSAGVAYSADGLARSGMGVDSADYDNDGREDLFVSNIDRERFGFYHNDGGESFTDVADRTGIGKKSYFLSGWGLKFFDYDNDGNVDLFLANGHPNDMIEEFVDNVTTAEPLLLFHNDGGRWTDVSSQGGPAFGSHWTARGLAIGDFDNDGGVDVLINNNGAAPLLLHNEVGARNNWLGVRLIGTTANIDAVGARATWGFGGTTRSQLKVGGGSYLSAHDPRMVLGIGQAKKLDFLEIRWPLPSKRVDRFTSLPINRYITIQEGKGIVS
jgi:hypothetical protein